MKKYIVIAIVVCAAFVAYFNFGTTIADAQSENREFEKRTENSTPSPETQSPEAQKEANFNALVAKAQEYGSVRVIVGLPLEFTPEGNLNESKRNEQRFGIKQAQSRMMEKYQSRMLKDVIKFKYIPYLAAEVTPATLELMKNDPAVAGIYEDKINQPMLNESTGQIGMPYAWGGGFSGGGWTVAVLDSGVDKFHPFLSGKVISEACYSFHNPSQGIYSLCPANALETTAPNSGLNCNTALISGCGHGTHVAGIAAGSAANLSGVAKGANIISMQVFYATENPMHCGEEPAPCIRTHDSLYMKALERVYELRNSTNIAAVNMSLGGGRYFTNCDAANSPVKTKIDNLRSVGIATVAASGNNNYADSISSPACISTAISVGSVGNGKTLNNMPAPRDEVVTGQGGSNSASFLNLLAPGKWIYSSIPNNGFLSLPGTSMAAPHVAGAWAILKQRNPGASVADILNVLTNTGVPVRDPRNQIVKPRIQVNSALAFVGATCGFGAIAVNQTRSGNLASTDCSFSDNVRRHIDYYTFNGTAGQQIAISQNSTAFDSFLILVAPNGAVLAHDDDGGGASNARIPANNGFLTLPATGTYLIYATSFNADMFGAYSLSLSTANSCSYAINPQNQNFPAAGGGGSVNVSTTGGCNWTATSSANWLSISGGAAGSGSGTVNFSVAANTSTVQRQGTLIIAGQTFTVTQAGLSCAYSINSTGRTVGANPFSAGFSVTTAAGCQWQASSNAGWITVNGGGSGSGNGTVSFAISRNTVRRPRAGTITLSANGQAQAVYTIRQLAPAAFDFDGDERSDAAVFRPSNGVWYINNSSNAGGGGFSAQQFGANGDVPVPGDFDADGKSDISVFRPASGHWFRLNSSDGQFISGQFGQNGDKPVIADFDGDGKAEAAVFRPSNGVWYWVNSSNNQFAALQFGIAEDKPVPADFDGDGKTDIAVYRPSNGHWYRINSGSGQFAATQFGTAEDRPSPADFDGDGSADIAVFRPTGGIWYLLPTSQQFTAFQFGSSGDLPASNAFVR